MAKKTAEEEIDTGTETLNFGDETFMHEGVTFTGRCSFDLNKELPRRQYEDLKAAKERFDTEQAQRLKGMQREGIMNPAPAPVHAEIENPEQPPVDTSGTGGTGGTSGGGENPPV